MAPRWFLVAVVFVTFSFAVMASLMMGALAVKQDLRGVLPIVYPYFVVGFATSATGPYRFVYSECETAVGMPKLVATVSALCAFLAAILPVIAGAVYIRNWKLWLGVIGAGVSANVVVFDSALARLKGEPGLSCLRPFARGLVSGWSFVIGGFVVGMLFGFFI